MTSRPDHLLASRAGLQIADVRASNRRSILGMIRSSPGISLAGLSRLSGLAPQTVSNLVDDLERKAFVRRGAVLRGHRGQPATPLFMQADAAYALGVEASDRHIGISLVDLSGASVRQCLLSNDTRPVAGIVQSIADAAKGMIDLLPRQQRRRVCGIALAAASGAADAAANACLDDWRELLSRATGLSVELFPAGVAGCWASLGTMPRKTGGLG